MTRGERILELRKQMKWSQKDLINATKKGDPEGEGASQQLISQLETDKIKGSIKLVYIARALNTSVEYLETGHHFIPSANHISDPITNIYNTQSHDPKHEQMVADAVDAYFIKIGYKPKSIEIVQHIRELIAETADIKESMTIPVLVKMLELKQNRS